MVPGNKQRQVRALGGLIIEELFYNQWAVAHPQDIVCFRVRITDSSRTSRYVRNVPPEADIAPTRSART
jgi:hypothetical protein